MRPHSQGRLIAFPVNIRPGWKRLTMTNTLTYYGHNKFYITGQMVEYISYLFNWLEVNLLLDVNGA